MMPTINAANPTVVDKFNPAPAVAQRSTSKDQANDSSSFHNILRKSSEEQQADGSNGEPVTKPATSKIDGSKKSEKDVRGNKKEKGEKDELQTAVDAAAQPVVIPQPKPDPFQALLTLLSVQQPIQQSQPVKNTSHTEVTSIATSVPVPEDATEVLAPATASDSTSEKAVTSKPDVHILTVTAKDKRSGAQSAAVPLSLDPILLNGSRWAKESTSATAANSEGSAVQANAVQTAKTDALVVPTQQTSEAMAPALSPKTLAFAMRLGSITSQPIDAAKNISSPPPLMKSLVDTSGLTVLVKAANAGEKENTDGSSADSGSMFGAAFADTSASTRTSSDKVSFTEAAHQVASVPAEEVPASSNTSDPLRNILLQLKGDDNRRVDVRMIDRDGELHVSVKSADPALAQQVQEHMPELTSRLSDQQFTHDVWMPNLSEVAKSGATNNSGNTFNNNGSGQSGQATGGNAGRQQNSNGQSRPDWVDLLENQLS